METRRLLRFSAGVGAIIILVAATLFWAQGTAAAGKDRCTLGTLKGTYVFAGQGTVVDGGAVVPYAEAGVWTLDGAGNAKGFFSASINGVTFASQKELTATYQHTTGCVYRAVDSESLEFDLYLSDKGDTITYYSAGFSGTQYKR
jgi:hypothetical protein